MCRSSIEASPNFLTKEALLIQKFETSSSILIKAKCVSVCECGPALK